MDRFECQGCHAIVTADAEVEDHKNRHGLIINIGPAPVKYRYLVEGTHTRLYDGEDAADAMAAWSKGISDGVEYVTLEALRSTRQEAS